MGYYTYFSISVDNAKPDQFIDIYKAFYKCMYDEEIDPSNKTHPYEYNGKIYAQGYGGREYEITDIGDQINSAFLCEDMKWYDYYENMVTISALFPEIIFHLRGDGEDSDDLWEADFMNGVGQQRVARIPHFDKEEFLRLVYEINPPKSKNSIGIEEII